MNKLKNIQLEHHHGLSFCMNLNMGLNKKVNIERIMPYVEWFYRKHLFPHFQIEEKVLFPILGLKHKKIIQALTEHKRLRELFEDDSDQEQNIRLIATELDHHIKYEERIVFPEIEKFATEEQMILLEDIHNDITESNDWQDQFWN